jgi:hypothetical protein
MLHGHGGASGKRPRYVPVRKWIVQVGGTCFSPDPETVCGLDGPWCIARGLRSYTSTDDTHWFDLVYPTGVPADHFHITGGRVLYVVVLVSVPHMHTFPASVFCL